MHQVTTFIVIIIMIFIGVPWLPNNTKNGNRLHLMFSRSELACSGPE